MSEEEIWQGNQFGGGNEMRVECQQTEGVRRRVPLLPSLTEGMGDVVAW